MNRSILTLLSALVLGVAIFGASYWTGQRGCLLCHAHTADDLAWMRDEFHLNDAEMARIRELHNGYMPKCMELCTEIAAKKAELQKALAGTTNVTPEVEAKLADLAQLRARCQKQMLEHFISVSQAMPPEEGRRYLAEMQRLTLGFHEEIEQSMASATNLPTMIGNEHH